MPRKNIGKAEPEKTADPKKQILLRGRKCYKIASEADNENRVAARNDIRFVNVPGEQWDANMKKRRGKRPCYEFNKLRINGKKVINEIRANRPTIKVRATQGGTKQIAEIYDGLIRNIWAQSKGDNVVDNAAEYQVDGGMGAWRVTTKYSDDTAFDQDIVIEGFKSPFSLHCDPNCQDLQKRDAEYWLVESRLSNDAYDSKYPKAKRSNFEGEGFDTQEEDWQNEETTRVCEYWYKEPYEKELWLVQFSQPDGTSKTLTVDSTTDEAPGVKQAIASGQAQLVRTRKVKCHRIMMVIMSGDAILEGPVEWAGSKFPFVMIYGEHKVVDGKFKWWGLHRFAKDAQQSYNSSRTAIDETIAQAPKAKYWATPAMAKGNVEQWAQAHDENLPALIANNDPQMPGRFPERMGGADVPVALIQQATVAAQDIRDVSGLHEASFGEESGEKSGIALARKQNQAQIVTYNFPDNIAKGIELTGEILIDLIPEVYDAERELRILGADGAENYVNINQLVPGPPDANGMPTTVRVNDLAAGSYDLTVTPGPSFSTRREEAAELWAEMANKFPQIIGVAGDLIAKSTDLPYSEEIAKRLQLLLPPQIQQQIAEGKDVPPEVQAAMAKVEQQSQLLAQQGQVVQQAAQEAAQLKADANAEKAQVEKAIANLKTEEAKFQTMVANAKLELQKQEFALAQKGEQLDNRQTQIDGQQQQTEAATSDLSEAKQTVAALDSMVAQITQALVDALEKIRAESSMVIAMPKKSRVKSFRTERDKMTGALIGIPEYDGESDEPRVARVVMKDGIGTPVYEDQMGMGNGSMPMMQ